MKVRIVSALVALVSAGIAFGQCPLAFDGSDQALVGVYIAPLNGGAAIADYNSSRLFIPASVMKAVTTAAAICRRGGDYRWETTVTAQGRIRSGVLDGNITITGSGDPTLGSDQFKTGRQSFLSALKEAAVAKGIDRITGKVDEGKPWPNQGPVPSWEIEDIPGIDGAGFYTLNYSDNVFVLSYPSMKTYPNVPGIELRYRGGSGGLRFFRNPGSNEINIYGQLGRRQKRASMKCSMPNPPAVLLAEADSIFHSGRKAVSASSDTLRLLTYRSPELRDVVRSMMIRSDNQMAEATLRLLAPGESRGAALAAERSLLTNLGVDLKGARLADGSGLSRHNAISPVQLASVLKVMARNGDYVGSFARVGLDGTVKNFMRGIPGRENFVLKSGSMTGVVCYVGYRLDPQTKAPTHVIAVMINNAPDPKAARAAISDLLSETGF